MYLIIMPSKMEVSSQHCDTVPNKTKDILYIVKIERIFYTFIFSLGQLRSIERFRTVETVGTVETVDS